jgi:shikimate dehydrogenase
MKDEAKEKWLTVMEETLTSWREEHPSTIHYAQVGEELSLSIHYSIINQAFEELEIDGEYWRFELDSEELLAQLLALFTRQKVEGFSVEGHFKKLLYGKCDELAPSAEKSGIVNTVLLKDEKITGYNTEVDAIEETLQFFNFPEEKKRAFIWGSGKAAQSVIAALLARKMECWVCGRSEEGIKQLKAFYGERINYLLQPPIYPNNKFDLVVNCTPVGGEKLRYNYEINAVLADPECWVIDMNYYPIRNSFLLAAEGAGARTISGMEVLVFSAAKSFELWTGKKAPHNEMKQEALHVLTGHHD